MRIELCDICNKTIDKDDYVTVGYKTIFPSFSLCSNCGKSVIGFMKKKKLITVEKKK